MRRLLLLLLLFSLASAEFRITALDVLADVQPEGSGQVTERMHLIITTDYHISLYESYLSKTDLASWASATGLEDVRAHLDNRYVNIKDLVVTPSPTSSCNVLADLCHGELLITYEAEPYMDSDGNIVAGTGVFEAEEYKPRTTKYSVNPNALYFGESELGDVILGEKTRLTFMLPQGARIVEVSPAPDEESAGGGAGRTQMSWTNRLLSHFTLEFEIEESLDQEVVSFFIGARTKVADLIYGPEGMAVLALAVIIVGAYFFLQTKVKR